MQFQEVKIFAKNDTTLAVAAKVTSGKLSQTCLNVVEKNADGSLLSPYPKQHQKQTSFTSTLSEIMVETLIPAHAMSSKSWEKLAARALIDQRLTVNDFLYFPSVRAKMFDILILSFY